MNDDLGKKAEGKIREWLDRPEEGYDFNRIPDQLTGFYGSKNICDFDLYKEPFKYYIESKATWGNSFAFSVITQRDDLTAKSKIPGVHAVVIVLFATYKRAFIIDIKEINRCIDQLNQKSLNITKVSKWPIKYAEIRTIPSRKTLLDYDGEIEEYME
jgi:hypothetical protein